MSQEKRSETLPRRFGLMGRDYAFLSLLILVLLILLLGARTFRQLNQDQKIIANSATNRPPPTTTTAAQPTGTATQPVDTPTPMPTPTPAPEQAAEVATSTASPTNTAVPAPTEDLQEPTVTPTPPAPTPTSAPTEVVSTPSPTSTNTHTPTPLPATVVYVQSHNQNHELNILTSDGVSRSLHLHAAAPAWSPDGTVIAFFGEPEINRLGGIYSQGNGVWLIDPRTQTLRQIVDTNHVKNIAWSPDGLKLAYEFGPDNSAHQIIVVDPRDGQEISRFAGEHPTWSPDSQRLAIKACPPEGSCGLWQVDLSGKVEEQITDHSSDSYPAWSTGGDLAFSSFREGDWEIYLYKKDGTRVQRLTDRSGTDTTPVFSPDNRDIYFRTDAFGDWQIRALDLSGNNERLVREGVGPSNNWGSARPTVWQPSS